MLSDAELDRLLAEDVPYGDLTTLSLGIGARPGRMVFRRHGSKPDDTLHAVNFGLQLARIVMGDPMNVDPVIIAQLRQAVGVAPVMSGFGRRQIGTAPISQF